MTIDSSEAITWEASMNRSQTFLNVTNGALYCVNMHAGLPYSCPRAIFKMLVPFVALRLNMFLSSTGALQLVYHLPADARRDCPLFFGAIHNLTNREYHRGGTTSQRYRHLLFLRHPYPTTIHSISG